MSIASKYKIIQPLGNQVKRKFSRTFLVEDKNTSTKYVLKALKKSEKPHLLERLKRESEFNFSMNGLPHVIDFYESDTELILILEFHEGRQLDEFWSSLGKKDQLPFLINLLKELEPIFQILEKQKIVHCDIKPSNLIINGKKEKFNVQLIDFGLAFIQDSNEARKTLFPLGYAAPELLLNKLSLVDQRSDIYSLGILIWRLFVGKLPLVHPNPSIFTNLQLTHPLPESSGLPKGVYSILFKMCGKSIFKLPPNTLPDIEVNKCLKDGIEIRYDKLSQIIEDFEKVKQRPRFYQRISRR